MVTLVPIVPEVGLNELTTGPAASAGAAPAVTAPAVAATASIPTSRARRLSRRADGLIPDDFWAGGGCGSGPGPPPGRPDPGSANMTCFPFCLADRRPAPSHIDVRPRP